MNRKKLSLSFWCILAAVLGSAFGNIAGSGILYLNMLGEILLTVIQIVLLFYVLASVTRAVVSGEAQDVGKMGIHTFKWIVVFTVFSACLGMGLACVIRPGEGAPGLFSSVLTMDNIEAVNEIKPGGQFVGAMSNVSMVPFLVLSMFFGIAMGAYAKDTNDGRILEWIKEIDDISEKVVHYAFMMVPLLVFCLVAKEARAVRKALVYPMAKFLLLLMIGDVIQFIVFVFVTGKVTGIKGSEVARKLFNLSILAIVTTSGSVCLPEKIREEVERFGISPKIANFTGPITMSMNSCGAVQCYVAAAVFLAQFSGQRLEAGQLALAILLSCLMCMGTTSVPGGSVAVYTFLAASLGIAKTGIVALVAVDWFAGMLRTLMNVNVDVMVGMLVASKMGELNSKVIRGEM